MTEYRNNFDALRLVGAILVLVNHSMELSGHAVFGFAGQSISTFGVKLFFVLSGYMIATSWMRDPHAGRFLLRRARRIMPALVFVVLVSILLIGPIFTTLPFQSYIGSQLTERYLGNLIFYVSYALPGVFATNPIPSAVNGSLWTLPVEVSMYIATPLLVFAGRRHAIFIGCLLLATIAVSMYYSVRQPPFFVILGTEFWTAATLVPYFVAGSLVAVLRLERFLDWRLGLLALGVLDQTTFYFGLWSEAALCVVLPYAAIAVGRACWPGVSRAGQWGDFSYGIYLWAFPIQQSVIVLVGPRLIGWYIVAFVSVPVFAIAFFSWHAIEKHALRVGRTGRTKPAEQSALESVVLP